MQRRTVPLLLSFTVTAALAATGTAHGTLSAPVAKAVQGQAAADGLVTQDLATRGEGALVTASRH